MSSSVLWFVWRKHRTEQFSLTLENQESHTSMLISVTVDSEGSVRGLMGGEGRPPHVTRAADVNLLSDDTEARHSGMMGVTV